MGGKAYPACSAGGPSDITVVELASPQACAGTVILWPGP